MDNCLVTKLKGTVSDTNIPVFNRLIMHSQIVTLSDTEATANKQLSVGFKGKFTISVSGDGYFVVGQSTSFDSANRKTTYDIDSENEVVLKFKNDNYDIYIDGKYDVTYIYTKLDSSAFEANVGFDIDDASYMTKLEKLRFWKAKPMSGSIDSLGRLSVLNELTSYACDIRGSIEGFVAAQVANGRTTNSTGVRNYALLGDVTFGGRKRSEITTSWITWNGATKIAVYVGTTIEAATQLYVKGYTSSSSEVVAWKAAGKTVTDADTNQPL